MFNPSPFSPSPFAAVRGAPPTSFKKPETSAAPPSYINYVADYGGCGHWRSIWPSNHLNMKGKSVSIYLNRMVFDKAWYKGVTCIRVQRQVAAHQLEFIKFLKSIQPECGFKMIYEIDDVIFKEDIPEYNAQKPAFDSDEVRQNSIEIINMCDEVTVTCDYMRRLYIERTGKEEVTVIPNFPPESWIGVHYNKEKVYRGFEKHKQKPRILYAGSGTHYDVKNRNNGVDDFSEIIEFVANTTDKYQWVFLGAFPPAFKSLVRDKKVELHPWVNIQEYPKKLSELDVQLVIAPLLDNSFNKSKSDIKFFEAAALGIPCLCQDLCTYNSVPAELRFGDVDEFERKIASILSFKNRKKYFNNVEKLRQMGTSRFLENPENIGCFEEVYNTPYGSKQRKFLSKWN
jgi:O-antigen biosynthesis protein